MPNQLTPAGLQVATQAELVAQFTADFQSIYGADINLDPDSPDGQMMNIFIQAILDLEDLLVQIYNGMDPDQAIGVTLDQRVALNGIQREGGTYSRSALTLNFSQAVVLPGLDTAPDAPYTVSDAAGNEWQLVTHQNIGPGVFPGLVFQAAKPGAVISGIGTINVPVTVVLGVTSINNPAVNIVTGANEESDSLLRVRRQKSVTMPSQGYLAALLATLNNIPGITESFIFENNGDATDSAGVPSHSIQAVIEGTPTAPISAWSNAVTYAFGAVVSDGGNAYYSLVNGNLNNDPTLDTVHWRLGGSVADYPIATAIYAKRNAGCGLFGTEIFVVTQADGTPFVVKWSYTGQENLYIAFNVTPLDGVSPVNVAGITAALPGLYPQVINGEVNINALATIVQSIDPNALVLVTPGAQGFSRDGVAWAPKLFPASRSNKFLVQNTAPYLVITQV